MKDVTEIRRRDFVALVLTTGIVMGLAIRLLPPVMAGSPINDGGLFYQMVRDLVSNHFRLPQFTAYNHLRIPYVYPPLGFYLTAGVQSLTGLDLYQIFRYLPPLLAALTIPAMWFLSSLLLRDRLRGAVAAFFYAVIPVSFSLLNMGGGITRAPGMLFLLLALACLYLLFTTAATRYLLLSALFGALLVLSHPESAFNGLFAGILFWVFFGRSWKSALQALALVALTAVVTAPWWLSNLMTHGTAPFLSALGDRPRDVFAFVYLIQFNLTGESLLTVVGVLAALGLFVSLKQRSWFLPAWIVLSFVTSPRAAPFASEIPIVLLAVTGFETIVGVSDPPLERVYRSSTHRNAFLVLIVYCFASGLISALRIGFEQRILPAERVAFSWIAQNIPPGSRFLVLTDAGSPAGDPISEWFPALTGSTSLATIQGHEWTSERTMVPAWNGFLSLQACLDQDPQCLVQWAANAQTDFSHVYVRKYRLNATGSFRSVRSPLEVLLRSSPDYRVIYDSPAAVILARAPVVP